MGLDTVSRGKCVRQAVAISADLVNFPIGRLSDGAVCVSVMEPYVVSTFNSSTGLQTLAIISSGVELPKFGKRVGERVSDISTINVSTVALTHHAAGTNAKLEIRKSNARDSSWMPNPTLVSITSGEIDPGLTTGDRYGKLDRIKLQDTIGLVDSRFTLPYFAGSASIEGYNFYGVEKAYAHVLIGWLVSWRRKWVLNSEREGADRPCTAI